MVQQVRRWLEITPSPVAHEPEGLNREASPLKLARRKAQWLASNLQDELPRRTTTRRADASEAEPFILYGHVTR